MSRSNSLARPANGWMRGRTDPWHPGEEQRRLCASQIRWWLRSIRSSRSSCWSPRSPMRLLRRQLARERVSRNLRGSFRKAGAGLVALFRNRRVAGCLTSTGNAKSAIRASNSAQICGLRNSCGPIAHEVPAGLKRMITFIEIRSCSRASLSRKSSGTSAAGPVAARGVAIGHIRSSWILKYGK